MSEQIAINDVLVKPYKDLGRFRVTKTTDGEAQKFVLTITGKPTSLLNHSSILWIPSGVFWVKGVICLSACLPVCLTMQFVLFITESLTCACQYRLNCNSNAIKFEFYHVIIIFSEPSITRNNIVNDTVLLLFSRCRLFLLMTENKTVVVSLKCRLGLLSPFFNFIQITTQ